METIFSKIIRKEIPATIAYEDELCLAFHDIAPKAPVHILIIPRKEIDSLEHLTSEDQMLIGHLFLVVQKIAKQMNIVETGYRIVINCGPDSGQEVPHLHLHMLGGRRLSF